MKRLLIYLSCFLLTGGGGTLLQSCERWGLPVERTLSINEGLVAYLPFTNRSFMDITTGTEKRIVNNAIWGNNNANPAFVKGFSDTQDGSDLALSFNGNGDFITLKDNPTLQFKTQFSISMWIKPDIRLLKRSGAKPMQLFHKSDLNTGRNESYSSALNPVWTYNQQPPSQYPPDTNFTVIANVKKEGTKSYCEEGGSDWQSAKFIVTSSILENNSWHHIVFVCNTSSIITYLDGNPLDNLKLNGGVIQSCPGGDLRFGMESNQVFDNQQFTKFFKGAMDEIRIYDRELNAKEVTSLFVLKKGIQ